METKELFYATFNRFELGLTQEQVDACSHQGACDDDVAFWIKRINFDHIKTEDLIEELSEYGAWSNEELQDRHINLERLLWLAAGSIKEEQASSK